ncbi:MAG: beta-propeller domain-containing protein [Bradymonadia bacterium]
MKRKTPRLSGLVAPALLAGLALGGCDQDTPDTTGPVGGSEINPDRPQPDPDPGQTAFISADGNAGQQAGRGDDFGAAGAEENAAPPADDGAAERTVEEGDIYRVLDGNRILNLNSYRGLQIIDFSDPAAPEMLGRVPLSGNPVEMYVVGDRAVVLLNQWVGYWGSRDDLRFGRHEGGVVALIDLADPSAPRLLGQIPVPGYIRTSRVTREGDQAALYVAAQVWQTWDESGQAVAAEEQTVVRSFEISGGRLAPRSSISLGGYVADIQGTPEALLVARNDYDWNRDEQAGSQVSVIDISSADGTMVEGVDVQVAGMVAKKTDMDLRDGVLRIVSGSRWGGSETNHLQTYDVTAPGEATPIDHETFGDGMDLYATLFMQEKAFFVTYRRVDPFHAFEITPEGDATEMSEFVVSGWNDWFKPVFGGDRLLGVGFNDEGGTRALAVSLYDSENLVNPEPLIERAEVDMEWGWSEASWDDRAFTVLQNAVAIESEDGALETGLILLPFSGWSEGSHYESGVQIYTFSEHTLTRRGAMHHDAPVRRSFMAEEALTANLSETSLDLYDTANPDAPEQVGGIELAPDYSDVLRFGDHRVRLKGTTGYWWYGDRALPDAAAQIIPAGVHPDEATPVAEITLHPRSQLTRVSDDLLVAWHMEYVDAQRQGGEAPIYETTLDTYDLSNPAEPRHLGSLTTRDIIPGGYYGNDYGGWGLEDCFDCGHYWGPWQSQGQVFVTGDDALTFIGLEGQQEVIGEQESCHEYVDYNCDQRGGEEVCYYGGITCNRLNGGPEVCYGNFERCEYSPEGGSCEAIERDALPEGARVERSCHTHDVTRYWQRQVVQTIDLSDPSAPALQAAVSTPADDEAQGIVQDGDTLYLSFKHPVEIEGDGRQFARYYIRPVTFAGATPMLGDAINVPGTPLDIEGDQIITQDLLWGEEIVETALARLQIIEAANGQQLAVLRARHRFEGQLVHKAVLDGAGNVAVAHNLAWQIARRDAEPDHRLHLSLLTLEDLDLQSATAIDHWASLQAAQAGRALFQVGGGLLSINTENAAQPVPQAFFPTQGWPSGVTLDGGEIIVPAGRFGVYRFDLDLQNLLPAPL